MAISYEAMKSLIGEMLRMRFYGCPKCKGTDKWCVLEMDDERGAITQKRSFWAVPLNRHVRNECYDGFHFASKHLFFYSSKY